MIAKTEGIGLYEKKLALSSKLLFLWRVQNSTTSKHAMTVVLLFVYQSLSDPS